MGTGLNGKEYVRSLINIAYLSIGVPLLFFIWVYLESISMQLYPIIPGEPGLVVFVVILIVTVALIIYVHLKYRNLIKTAQLKSTFTEKLMFYKQATTWRYVSYGVVSMLISMGLYTTDVKFFEPLFFVMVVLMSVYHPNAQRMVRELKLKDKDKDVILKGLDF